MKVLFIWEEMDGEAQLFEVTGEWATVAAAANNQLAGTASPDDNKSVEQISDLFYDDSGEPQEMPSDFKTLKFGDRLDGPYDCISRSGFIY
ncbi:MAG: hypothetical protein KGL39_50495 [Patescibacteria group bacterium]|nr:hypothetical protein [Patescibacteria group bacterium]